MRAAWLETRDGERGESSGTESETGAGGEASTRDAGGVSETLRARAENEGDAIVEKRTACTVGLGIDGGDGAGVELAMGGAGR